MQSMSPNVSTIAGGVITIVNGENFGSSSNSYITFSVIDVNANKDIVWKDINYVSTTEINVTSLFGLGQNLIVRLIVDGIGSTFLNMSEQFKFSYLDPKINDIISPPLLGGTL